MSSTPRRVRTWKIVVAIAVLLALGAGVVTWRVDSAAGLAYERLEARLTDLEAQAASRVRTRPVLRGEPVPGNAWDDYMATPALWPKNGPYQPAMVMSFLDGRPYADKEFIRNFVSLGLPVLDRLRAGTRRSAVHAPFKWSQGWFPIEYHQTQAMTPCDVARCSARLLREEGKHREAMELLLDVCQYGRDLGQNSTPTQENLGRWVLERTLQELVDLVRAGGLSASDHVELDRELTILDQHWPDPEANRQNLVCLLGSGLSNEVRSGGVLYAGPESRYLHSWRWLFSGRLRAARTIAATDSWCETARRTETLPWPEHRQARQEILGEVSRWPEPIVRLVVRDAFAWPNHARNVRARLRLLRVAARFLAMGETLTLADPFGKSLGCSVTGGHLKAWSAGVDGNDDGGAGDWVSGNDIVLEVDR